MEHLCKDLRRHLLLHYCSTRDWIALLLTSKLFHVLTPREKLRKYGDILMKLELQRRCITQPHLYPLVFYPAYGNVVVSDGTGNPLLYLKHCKYICGQCAEVMRPTHVKKHCCSVARCHDWISMFTWTNCDRCSCRVRKCHESDHKQNVCPSYTCPHCTRRLCGVEGVYYHARKCRLFGAELHKLTTTLSVTRASVQDDDCSTAWLFNRECRSRAFNLLTSTILTATLPKFTPLQ